MQHRHLRKPDKGLLTLTPVLLIFAGFILSCSEPAKVPATTAPSQAQKPMIVSVPTKTAEEKLAAVYQYNPDGRRDPFAPIIQRESKKAKSGDKPPLERYNVSEFKLSGIIWGGFGYNAMLEGPDGKGYFVRTGTVMGPNGGIVKKISQNMLIVEEKYKNYTGETERKEIVIELRKKQEATP